MNDYPDSLHVTCPACGGINRLPATRLSETPKCGACGARLLTGAPVELTTADFDRFVLRNDLPVLVDFWAPWCAPCKVMAPAFADAARQFATAVRFAKLDTEAHPAPARRYDVRSIPTLILLNHGREQARIMGARSAGDLARWLRTELHPAS